MHQHPVYAYELLSPIEILRPALDIPYCHHEKWDGSGYPRGLGSTEIPLSARVFAVVDVWDALHSDRSYRPAWSNSEVDDYLHEQSGRHFDPDVIRAFFGILH
jgi:HD-GYP domain-containing protein (c-di-GMP phosphodiesterase class II)